MPLTWFITGASSGVGRAVAEAALRRGDRVAAAVRNPASVADLVDQYPAASVSVPLDVHDQDAARRAVGLAVEKFGRIDVLLNSAGVGQLGAVEDTPDAQARAIFETNVFGVLNVLRAALPVLRAQRAGHVIQVSSNLGQVGHPGTGLLSASKHAVSGFTEAAAAELAPLGVSCTLLEPGAIGTPFLDRVALAEPTEDYRETAGAMLAALTSLPPSALADPGRIAQAVLTCADAEHPPPRLALGSTAEEDIRQALTARLHLLDQWSDLTRSVDLPAV